MYIVELEKGVWIAPWTGDPGRTLVIENARIFPDRKIAKRYLKKAQKMRPFKNAKIIETNPHPPKG
jgi:hypothetical protein